MLLLSATVDAAQLSGSATGGVGATNLTTAGQSDWVHWGRTSVASVNRKAGVALKISGLTILGAAPGRFGSDPEWNSLRWTDGTPTTSSVAFSGGIYFPQIGNGYQLTVPAGTTPQTISIYLGGWASTSAVVATLSDGSAAPYTTTFGNASAVYARVVTLTFSAATNGQALTVRHTLQSTAMGGNIGVQAAALQGVVNQAPSINSIGDKGVTVAGALVFGVTATDPDGPAPLLLAISSAVPSLPPAASFVDNGNGTGNFNWTPAPADVGSYLVTFAATQSGAGGLSTQQTVTITVDAPVGSGTGSLSGTVGSGGPTTINLTMTGTGDWQHWGRTTVAPNRKAGVVPRISALTLLGAAPVRFVSNPSWNAHTWNDGTPKASSGSYAGGIYFVGIGSGYQLTVPATPSPQTLKLSLGGFKSTSQIVATLSDGSAPPYSVTIGNLNDTYNNVVTVQFAAASSGQTLTVRHTMLSGTGGNIALQSAALMLPFPIADDFNDGNANGWTTLNDSPIAAKWQVVAGTYRQQNHVEGTLAALAGTFHLGAYSYFGAGSAWTDYRLSVQTRWSGSLGDDIGVMFRYRDANNYYRLSLNSRYGFTRLEKKVAGIFTPLATNSRGYLPDELLHLNVEVRAARIFVSINGDPIFAVTDTSLDRGTVALYSQDRAEFDTVLVEAPSASPRVYLVSPLAYGVNGDSVRAIAQTNNVPLNGYVSFLLDDLEVLDDFVPPYDQTFASVGPGDHEVAAILRSPSGAELDRDTNVLVGAGGDYEVAIGDSITNGVADDYRTDNLTRAPRVVAFGGYPSLLTALLDETDPSRGKYLVFNEAISGDDSRGAAVLRLDSIQARHPSWNRALILLGTNDAIKSTPSGQGCAGAACNGTYKGNMQQLIDKIRWSDYPANSVPSNVTAVVALIPPAWTTASPWNSAINDLIRSYNTVISEELVGREIGPDFFSYFMADANTNLKTLFADRFHPNSLGYTAMSVLWHNALRPSSPLPLPFVIDRLVTTGLAAPRQSQREVRGLLYSDAPIKLTNIPAELDGGRWVISANGDMNHGSENNYLTFEVDRPVKVYVAYDAAASMLPGWMTGFSDTGLSFGTTNPLAPSMRLYVKSFAAGHVMLGGNLHPPAVGATANYVVIVVEE